VQSGGSPASRFASRVAHLAPRVLAGAKRPPGPEPAQTAGRQRTITSVCKSHCEGTFPRASSNDEVAPSAAIRRAANNEGPWDHPVTTLVSRTGRDLVAAPGGDLGTPCAARSARARRATPSTLNRCRARSADSLASDACSRYRIGAEAAQSGRGSDPGRGRATADVRCN